MARKTNEQKAKDLFRSKEFRKEFERATGFGRYELRSIDVVYCHAIDKFVCRDGCHYCRGLDADYSDSNHEVYCDKANDEAHPYHGEWTLEEMIKMLKDERNRIRREKKEELEDREKYGPIKRLTDEEIEERERFARDLGRVSVEDMFRPFTI